MRKRIIGSTLLVGLIACSNQIANNSSSESETLKEVTLPSTPENYALGYNLGTPDVTMKLSKKLEEISGLSMSKDGQQLVAIEDENGKVYLLDKTTGEIQQDFTFWKSGDYEGVEVVGSDIYVLKSSGTLYRVSKPGETDQVVEKYNSVLDQDNDVEGLAYDQVNHRLLLACKAKAGDGEAFQAKKGIYAFDLQTLTLQENPAYVISLPDIHEYLETAPAIRKLEKLAEMFAPGQSDLTFAPSGIAIHPITKDIFIISSVGKVLLVLSASGKLLHIEKMSKEVHPQPEGICFDEKGNLYIANEGKGGTGKIFRFDYSH